MISCDSILFGGAKFAEEFVIPFSLVNLQNTRRRFSDNFHE